MRQLGISPQVLDHSIRIILLNRSAVFLPAFPRIPRHHPAREAEDPPAAAEAAEAAAGGKRAIIKPMKHKTTLIVIASLILISTAWALGMNLGKNDTDFSIKNITDSLTGESYVASGHPEWPPFMWKEGNDIVGIGPQLLAKIAKDLKMDIRSDYAGTWDEVQEKTKSGEIDVLAAAYKTEEREEHMIYSVPYAVDPVALFTKKGRKFLYDDWKDLIGKKGVATIGDSYGQEFDEYMKVKLKVKRVETVEEAFQMIEKGTADYFIYAFYAGEKTIKSNSLEEKITVVPEYVSQENFYVAVSKKSSLAGRMDEINDLIEKYKKDGTIDRLIEYQRKDADL